MKRFDYRILVGAGLILFGILLLLDQTGILKGAVDLFWAGVLAIGAAIFLFWFFWPSWAGSGWVSGRSISAGGGAGGPSSRAECF